jgi:hypothetical protein
MTEQQNEGQPHTGRTDMDQPLPGRGAAEESTGVPDTGEEHQGPASPSSTPGGEPARAEGDAEQSTPGTGGEG